MTRGELIDALEFCHDSDGGESCPFCSASPWGKHAASCVWASIGRRTFVAEGILRLLPSLTGPPSPPPQTAAPVSSEVETALRAVWGDIVVRWNGMITARLNTPDKADILDIMGHTNDAFRAALSLPLPDEAAPPAPTPQKFDPATAPYCRKHRIYKKAVAHYFCEDCYSAGEATVGPSSAHDAAPAPTPRNNEQTGEPWSDAELLLLDAAIRLSDVRYQDAAMILHSHRAAPAPTPLCAICRQQMSPGHACWAWHKYCRAELNPVALVQWLQSFPQTDDMKRVLSYVVTVTGMDDVAAPAPTGAPAPSPPDRDWLIRMLRQGAEHYRNGGQMVQPNEEANLLEMAANALQGGTPAAPSPSPPDGFVVMRPAIPPAACDSGGTVAPSPSQAGVASCSECGNTAECVAAGECFRWRRPTAQAVAPRSLDMLPGEKP